jgi:hypothetical protein
MIGELTVGRRYRITLHSKAFPGHLEGRLRSVKLPRGVLGNDDGFHSIWLSGESFDWFLRPEEIDAVEELPEKHGQLPSTPLVPSRICERADLRTTLSRVLGVRRPLRARPDPRAARSHRAR